MAAHRYWRARGLQAYDDGATVELSEFWLMETGVRVDAGATLTSTVAPVAGSLADLKDDDTATGCTLSTDSVLKWDFDASPADVDDIRLGSGDTLVKFLRFCLIEWSDDDTAWTTYNWGDPVQQPQSFAFPGARTMTTTYDPNGWDTLSFLSMAVDAGDRRIISTTGAVQHWARAEAHAGAGVRQFEIERTSWSVPKPVGVWRIEDITVDRTSEGGWDVDANQDVGGIIGSKTENGGANLSYPTGGFTSSDVFGCVIDFDAGTMTAYKNGVSLGVAFSTLQGVAVRPGIGASGTAETVTLRTNGFTYPITGATPWTRSMIAPGVPTPLLSFKYVANAGGGALYSGTPRFLPIDRTRPDYNFNPAARGRIVGTVKRDADPDNLPMERRVRLYRDRDGMLIREIWSDAAGDYQFDYVEEWEAYTVIAHDYQFLYRAVVADNLTLANGGVELMA